VPRCKRCNKSGLFLKLNKDGICRKCEEELERKKVSRCLDANGVISLDYS
jgi:hypothetical protein